MHWQHTRAGGNFFPRETQDLGVWWRRAWSCSGVQQRAWGRGGLTSSAQWLVVELQPITDVLRAARRSGSSKQLQSSRKHSTAARDSHPDRHKKKRRLHHPPEVQSVPAVFHHRSHPNAPVKKPNLHDSKSNSISDPRHTGAAVAGKLSRPSHRFSEDRSHENVNPSRYRQSHLPKRVNAKRPYSAHPPSQWLRGAGR